jgi:putative aldouronate transport system permease protein
MKMKSKNKYNRFQALDAVLLVILGAWAAVILLPFINVVAISFSSQKAYADSPLLLFPTDFVLSSYKMLFSDGRIWIGFRTTFQLLLIALPLNMFLTSTLAYGLSRKDYPGRKLILRLVLITMLFNGGIIPLYLTVKSYGIMGTLSAVALSTGLNTFYMIIMVNFFQSLPESLVESAKLDGAGEWRILFKIIIPLSKPVFATVFLYYFVDRWNEWYNAMIMIRNTAKTPLQLILRNIVLESQAMDNIVTESVDLYSFSIGIKMAAVVVTIVPVMCVYPFLQRYFTKGIMLGAVKS